jgi:predicted ATPase
MIIPTVQVGTSQLSFNQLSEGTLRTMAVLFYVVTDKSELLLLEEPEVCVHHGLLSSVIQVIKEYGRTKQIIFSTHSETVVDALTPEQVLLVDRHKNKGTTVTQISEEMSQSGFAALKTYLATAGNLGEYWRHSGFGR